MHKIYNIFIIKLTQHHHILCINFHIKYDTITKEKFSIFWKNLKTYISLVYEILYQIIGAPASGSGQAGKARRHSSEASPPFNRLKPGVDWIFPPGFVSVRGYPSSPFVLPVCLSQSCSGLLWFCFFKNFLLKFYFFA